MVAVPRGGCVLRVSKWESHRSLTPSHLPNRDAGNNRLRQQCSREFNSKVLRDGGTKDDGNDKPTLDSGYEPTSAESAIPHNHRGTNHAGGLEQHGRRGGTSS